MYYLGRLLGRKTSHLPSEIAIDDEFLSKFKSYDDLYTYLGVRKSATAEEIRQAYRARAKIFHPDLNRDDKSAEQAFQLVTEAYGILSDPAHRKRYDKWRQIQEDRQNSIKSWISPRGIMIKTAAVSLLLIAAVATFSTYKMSAPERTIVGEATVERGATGAIDTKTDLIEPSKAKPEETPRPSQTGTAAIKAPSTEKIPEPDESKESGDVDLSAVAVATVQNIAPTAHAAQPSPSVTPANEAALSDPVAVGAGGEADISSVVQASEKIDDMPEVIGRTIESTDQENKVRAPEATDEQDPHLVALSEIIKEGVPEAEEPSSEKSPEKDPVDVAVEATGTITDGMAQPDQTQKLAHIKIGPIMDRGPIVAPLSGQKSVALVKKIQTELARLNCYSGPIDGQWGVATNKAASKWRERRRAAAKPINHSDGEARGERFLAELERNEFRCINRVPPKKRRAVRANAKEGQTRNTLPPKPVPKVSVGGIGF